MRKFSTLKRGPTGHARMATALAAVGALVMSGGLVMLGASPAATADGQDHVFVCKYVGTPGEDEVLKSGKQPIRVAAPATTEDGYFNDAQGRSYVLDESTAENTGPGNAYLGTKICPPPDNPDGHLVDYPEVGVNDPCGPANATWILPANTPTFTWEIVDGHLIVTIIAEDVFFRGHKSTHDYGLAVDSGTAVLHLGPGRTEHDGSVRSSQHLLQRARRHPAARLHAAPERKRHRRADRAERVQRERPN